MSAQPVVRSVMTTEVVAVRAETSVAKVLDLLVANRISGVPVVGSDRRIVGMVSEADLMLKAEYPDLERARYWSGMVKGTNNRAARSLAVDLHRVLARRAGDLMTEAVVTITPMETVEQAAHLMHKCNVKRLPVVDPQGRLVGIVSRYDLLKALHVKRGRGAVGGEATRRVAELHPPVTTSHE